MTNIYDNSSCWLIFIVLLKQVHFMFYKNLINTNLSEKDLVKP